MPEYVPKHHTRDLCGKGEAKVADNVVAIFTGVLWGKGQSTRFTRPSKVSVTNESEEVWIFEVETNDEGYDEVSCYGHGRLNVLVE